MKNCIVVLGMHRSGTSAFAGVLNILGVYLGKNILNPTEDNPKGFFENNNIVQINEKILKSLDSSWDDVFLLPERWWVKQELNVYRKEAREIIKDEMSSGKLCGIKDPRLCILLPFWQDVFKELDIKPYYVVCVRHPLEVAESLKKRNGFSVEKAVILWMKYMLDAEFYSREFPRVFVTFDDLLDCTEKTINKISEVFNINFPSAYQDVSNNIEQFLEPSLKHYSIKINKGHVSILDHISDYYSALSDLTQKAEVREDYHRLKIDTIRRDFLRSIRYFFSAATDEIKERDKTIQELQRTIQELQRTIQELQQSIQELLNSASWRITKPLRKVKSFSRQFLSCIEKYLHYIWISIRYASKYRFSFSYLKSSVHYIKLYGFSGFIKKIKGKIKLENPYQTNENLVVPEITLINVEEEIACLDDITISVIIPTKNAGTNFLQLLPMLKNQKGFQGIEIIIVDSGSTDGTINVAKAYGATIIEIPPEKFSHSYSRNLGAESAAGHYLLFTVQDSLPPSDLWLYEMFDVISKNAVVAVSCAEFPRTDADLFYRVLSWNHYRFLGVDKHDRILSLPDTTDNISLRKNGQLSDIACLISRDIFSQYRYRYNYAEDLDLGIRLIRDGHKLAFLGSARIIHSHNRNPYYYLKRGYVDNLFLTSIFPDHLIPNIKVEKMMKDILFTFSVVGSVVHETAKIHGSCQQKEFVSMIRKSFGYIGRHAGIVGLNKSDEISNKYIDDAYRSFLERIGDRCSTQSDSLKSCILTESIFNFARIIFEYMEQTYEVIDEYVLEDFKCSLYKTYALMSGAHLAYGYIKASESEKNMFTEIHNELIQGI